MEILRSLEVGIKDCRNSVIELRDTVSWKEDSSPVTDADFLLDQRIAEILKHHYPGIRIFSEEAAFPVESLESGWVAIVDPLDGTLNFSGGLPIWGVAVSLWLDKRHICSLLSFPELDLSLATGDLPRRANSGLPGFSGSTSAVAISSHAAGAGEFRVFGSAAFNIFCVATGRLASFHNTAGAHVWDFIAGINLALEQGCKVMIDDEEYGGCFLEPTRKYTVKVFNA